MNAYLVCTGTAPILRLHSVCSHVNMQCNDITNSTIQCFSKLCIHPIICPCLVSCLFLQARTKSTRVLAVRNRWVPTFSKNFRLTRKSDFRKKNWLFVCFIGTCTITKNYFSWKVGRTFIASYNIICTSYYICMLHFTYAVEKVLDEFVFDSVPSSLPRQ